MGGPVIAPLRLIVLACCAHASRGAIIVRRVQRSRSGWCFTTSTAAAPAVTVEEAVVVTDVEEGCGLQVGDVLLSADGAPLADAGTVAAVEAADAAVEFVAHRDEAPGGPLVRDPHRDVARLARAAEPRGALGAALRFYERFRLPVAAARARAERSKTSAHPGPEAAAGPEAEAELRWLLFLLAHLRDAAGDAAGAWASARRGNALARRRQRAAFPGLRSRLVRRAAEVLRDWTDPSLVRALLARASPPEKTDAPRLVFVVGLPRSGSTLIEAILARHPHALSAGEFLEPPREARRLRDVLAMDDETLAALAADYRRRVVARARAAAGAHAAAGPAADADSAADAGPAGSRGGPRGLPGSAGGKFPEIPKFPNVPTFHAGPHPTARGPRAGRRGDPPRRSPRVTHVVNKQLTNWLNVGLLAWLFPSATFVHADRDVRDAAASMFLTPFVQGPQGAAYSTAPASVGRVDKAMRRVLSAWRSLSGPGSGPGAAAGRPAAAGSNPAGARGGDFARVHTVPYETLVRDPESGARALLAHVGLAYDARCLDPAEARAHDFATASRSQVRRAVYTSSVGRWRRHAGEEEMRELVEQLRERRSGHAVSERASADPQP
jgi:hypothetical protein